MSPTTHFEPALVRIEPACRYLDVGRSKLYELIREGKLEAVKIGKSARITTPSLKRCTVPHFRPRLRRADTSHREPRDDGKTQAGTRGGLCSAVRLLKRGHMKN